MEVQADLQSAERMGRVHSFGTESPPRLNIATVSKQPWTRRALAYQGDRRTIFVNAKMQPGLQIEPWTRNAEAAVAKLQAELPDGIALDIVYRQNTYTGDRMVSLATNLIFALILVLLVLIWMMGLRSAVTVGLALPLSAAMVLIGMMYLDIPLHQMSVTGLIISLGLLIDNAIVVVEDYKLKRKSGAAIADAINQSVHHLWIPQGIHSNHGICLYAHRSSARRCWRLHRHSWCDGCPVGRQLLLSGHDCRARLCRLSGRTLALAAGTLVAAGILKPKFERDISAHFNNSH